MAGAGSDGRDLFLGWMMLPGKGMALQFAMSPAPYEAKKGMDESPCLSGKCNKGVRWAT